MERDRVVEKEARTIDEAISEALRELNAERENVTVETVSEASKGFLGIGAKKAKVRVTEKYVPERFVKTFLEDIIRASGMEASVIIEKVNDNRIKASVEGKDIGTLIGKRGATLDSLQYLVNLAVNKGNSPFMNVIIDTENYRDRRKATLEQLAKNLAKKVRSAKKPVKLEPMSSSERRIIHASLQENMYVTTYSEGEEPFRNLVIAPSKKQNLNRENREKREKREMKTTDEKPEARHEPEKKEPEKKEAKLSSRNNQNNQRRHKKPVSADNNESKRIKEVTKEEPKSTLFVSRPLDKRYFDNTRPFNPRPKKREESKGEPKGEAKQSSGE
jgi:spoIIIJ-associated protein